MKEYLTLKQIQKKGACPSQCLLFEKTFGEKAELTVKNANKAIEVGLNINWFANSLYTIKYKTRKATVKKNLLKEVHCSGIADDMLKFQGKEVTLIQSINHEVLSFRILEDIDCFTWNKTMFVNGNKLKPLKVIGIELIK